MTSSHKTNSREPGSRLGFWLGLLVGLGLIALSGVLPRPDGLSVEAIRLLGVTLWIGIWWITEAIPIGATSLLPAALFPLLGIAPANKVSPAYASPFIHLLLGGFLLALAVERSGVHRRIALYVLLWVGTSPRRLILGFAVAAAVLSMWISNTATTLIMLPVAMAIADRATDQANAEAGGFGIAVLLATAYGASVGGMGTPVGTPPNLIAMGAIAETFPELPEMTFVGWAWRALPAVVVVVPIVWLMLTRVYPKVPSTMELGADAVIREELARLGAWKTPEIRSLAVFGLAAGLWVFRPDLQLGTDLEIPGWMGLLGLKGVHDGTVALFAACLAFALPSGEEDGSRLLPWSTAITVPWGLVFLFGGGIALSRGFEATGLSIFLGKGLAQLAGDSAHLLLGAATLSATFGTEIISNTALATISMPILAATAQQLGTDPVLLLLPVALACSCAFMMPAATGPNAIVFGSGRVRIRHMVKAGFFINWAAWAVIFGLSIIIHTF